jgi:hypothetical protein
MCVAHVVIVYFTTHTQRGGALTIRWGCTRRRGLWNRRNSSPDRRSHKHSYSDSAHYGSAYSDDGGVGYDGSGGDTRVMVEVSSKFARYKYISCGSWKWRQRPRS